MNYEIQLNLLLKELEKNLNIVEKSFKTVNENDNFFSQIQDAEQLLQIIRLDMKDLPLKDQEECRKRIRNFSQKLRFCKRQLNFLKTNDVSKDVSTDIITHGRILQDQSISTLQNCVSVIGDTAVIARDTATVINKQTEQIQNQIENLNDIQETQMKANKTIKSMTKTAAKSRVIQGLTLSILAGIGTILGLRL